jgi:hypothetical protein
MDISVKDVWEFVVSEEGAVVGAVFVALCTAIGFLLTWRKEIRWKRLEFIFAQCQYLENDSEIRLAIDVLAGRTELTTAAVYSKTTPFPDQLKYQAAFEKLFGFLDRIAYAVKYSKTLSFTEIAEFGWHFRVVCQDKNLAAETTGFPCMVAIAPALQTHIVKTFY